MNNMKKPQIRFKGFTNDWEQRKLSNIADIVGGGTPSTSNPDYWDGDIDWYTPAEIGEQIFAYGSVRKITKEGLIHSSAKILPAHKTVLFTSRAGIGNMAILKRPAATNQGFQSLVCHDDIDPYFMFSMGDSIKAKAERVAAGSTFAEISGKKLGELEFMFPDTDEQKAIGAYFKNLDYLITLHQRKYEKLQIIKKSMLENCFPKNGEKVPKIRFSGFTGDWEQRKLSDLVDVCSGMDYKHLSIGNIPVFGTGGYMLSVDKALSYDRDAIGIGRKGTIDKPYILKAPFWTVDTLFYCIPRDEGTLNFDYDLFQCIDWKQKDESTGVPSLSKVAINDTDVMVPKTDEQKKIGYFFEKLDLVITLHQSELEKLQKIKKSLLERMFV